MKLLRILAIFFLLVNLVPDHTPVQAAAVIPPTWSIVADNFESGSLVAWGQSGQVALQPGGGYGGSTGLAVTVNTGSSFIYQSGVAKAMEGYLTFWFNPNNVSLPEPTPNYYPPGSSLSLAEVTSSSPSWPPLVDVYLRKPPGQGYKGYLAWPNDEAGDRTFDYANAFDVANGWQQITIGYHVDEWVAVWVNGALVRQVTSGVVHPNPYGDVIYFGKIHDNSASTPSGTLLFDDVTFQVPRVNDLWVDAVSGNDANTGLASGTAFRTIQKAADMAGPGTTVHILPGIYRETVWPALNGTPTEPVVYRAENGPGTVTLRGSETSASLAWTQLSTNTIGLPAGVSPSNIYSADLSSWNLTTEPRFVMSSTTRLPLAREPDWSVVTEWKTQEFWWAADGGSAPAACDPVTNSDHNCDLPQRSLNQLTDRTNDTTPAGIEPGNLTTLGNLTGARLVAIDTVQGHYNYRRTITAHDVAAGHITVDRICEHDSGSGNPGLGWGTKYFIENKASLLDTPGEWWYDPVSKRLYLWPPAAGNPAAQNIEISRRDNGFDLHNRSYTVLDGLTIELVNQRAVSLANWIKYKSYGDTLRNLRLQYANYGVYIAQGVAASEPAANVIDGFTLENSTVAYIDSQGISLGEWWDNNSAADAFVHSGVRNTVIRGNEFHHLGFRTDGDNANGMNLSYANQLRFEDNYVHQVAHNGVEFGESVIQSNKTYGFAPGEIKTGDILVKDNIFEKACQLTTDCGGLKFWGKPPDNHVYRDVLITGNIFRDSFGWSYVSEKRGRYTGGASSQVRGMGGIGLYVDNASGIHAYRNIAYNNASEGYTFAGVWRDGQIIYANNVAANSLYGISLGGGQNDTHGSVDTQIVDNVLLNNEAFGMSVSYAAGRYANTTLDRNLYFNNGWRPSEQGGFWHAGTMVVSDGTWKPYATLTETQAATPWEDNGVAGDPALWNYNVSDHDLWDGSWPDFHLTSASTAAIDRGLSALPASLTTLLTHFNVTDYRSGAAFDLGRYEAGYQLLATPAAQAIDPGGTAQYTLRLFPSDLPYSVTLAAVSPSPSKLLVGLSAATLALSETATLTVTQHGVAESQGYTLQVTSSGGGFNSQATVWLLVGGARIYLPLVQR